MNDSALAEEKKLMNLTGVKRVVFSEEEIKNRVLELGRQISEDYKDKIGRAHV